MRCDNKQCKNKKSCEKANETGELVKCKFEPLEQEKVDKFCEDYIKAFMGWREPNKFKTLMELVELFDEYFEV